MSDRYCESKKLYNEAIELMPGGVNSPVRAFGAVGGEPVFFKKGQGAIVTDADQNSYVDFCQSWGPLILGHAHPAVVEAASSALKDGLSFGACCEKEIELAKLVLEAFKEYDRVRFVSSGTEAVMTAVRLARGVTRRAKILKFDGCYHGHADHLLVKAGSGLITQSIASSKGVPEEIASQTLVCELDDENAVEKIFEEQGSDIAAIVLEPLPANAGLLEQRQEYLKFLREITTKYGALLIFDEVISGLRLRFGGYMHECGIVPDIVTLGKIVGGGMPVGALVAKKDIMEQLAPNGAIYQAGTLSGNPVAMASGIATLQLLREGKVYQHLDELGKVQDESYTKLSEKYEIFNWTRKGSISWLHLAQGEMPKSAGKVKAEAIKLYNKHHREMLNRGYYLAPSAWEVAFASYAHTKEHIEGLANAWDEVLKNS